ncbi:DUF6884 domain-containing protein [Bradyrhizobium sp. HKCCYLS1011]|uniref:DUF6884 domain-containing protein n=1 Tax=Bradyrhizobium sp. HKCCYLS1011 TaxID=3420733 RepID=UPI003EC09E4F
MAPGQSCSRARIYREFLMHPLTARFDRVDVPMEGLQMGEQLSWMKNILGG